MTRLKFERTRRGLSQGQLGAIVRIKQPTVGLIEQGRLVPTAEQLERFAVALGVPPDVLLLPAELVEPRLVKRA